MGNGEGGEGVSASGKSRGRRRRLRIPDALKQVKPKKKARAGYPSSVWNSSTLSEPSKKGHRLAGPIMKYDDDT